MAASIISIVSLSLATAAISLTVTRAKVSRGFRKWITAKNAWLGELFSCPYCFSHWVAAAFVVLYRPQLTHKFIAIDLFVSVFVVVALSAVATGSIMSLMAHVAHDTDG